MSRDALQEPKSGQRSASVAGSSRASSANEDGASEKDHNSLNNEIGDDGETYTFRLFADPIAAKPTAKPDTGTATSTAEAIAATASQELSKHIPTVQRIRLTSPEPSAQHGSSNYGATWIKARPMSYYIASPPTEEQRFQYAASAISGDTVLELASRPNPGMRMPWRVTAASFAGSAGASRDPTSASDAKPDTGRRGGRTRPGKKTRLDIRRRKQAADARAAAQIAAEKAREEEAKAKEEKIRLRNKARNREKQLKKRQKAREARTAGSLEQTDGKIEKDLSL